MLKTLLMVGLSLVIGILLGRWTVRPADGNAGQANPAVNSRPSRSSPPRAASETSAGGKRGRLMRDIRAAKADQLPALTYRALEVADPVERSRYLAEIMALIDATNAFAVMEQFSAITRETGRLQHGEWRAALFAVGKACGNEAMEVWKNEGTQAEQAIAGWASADPQAALAWLNESDNAAQRDRLLSSLLRGAAIGDPEVAKTIMSTLPESERTTFAGTVMDNLITSQGLDATVDWVIAEQLSRTTTSGDGLSNQILRKIYDAAEWTGGEDRMAGRIERLHAANLIQQSQLVGIMARMHGVSGLNLAHHLASGPVMANSDERAKLLLASVETARRGSPAQVATWLEQHPSSPIHDQVTEVMAQSP